MVGRHFRDQPFGHAAAVSRLLHYAALYSPYFRDQPWASRVRAGRGVDLADLPITPRSEFKRHTAAFYGEQVPETEGRIVDKFTSGSTGEPTLIKKTRRHFQINSMENTRLRQGWGYEGQSGIIKTSIPTGAHLPGSVVNQGATMLSHDWCIYTLEPKPIIDLLCRTQCSHIVMRPSQAISVLELEPPVGFLKLLTTVGEVNSPELDALVAGYPGLLHHDVYGSVETGLIASTCRKCGRYHPATGHLILEVLDGQGRAAKAGAMGRVIVTPLFNFAMPLLRYDIGDYAVPAADEMCDTSLRGLTRIIGREKDLFILPNGTRITPHIGEKEVFALGIRKFKLVQVSRMEIEFRYIAASPELDLAVEQVQPLIDFNFSPLIRARLIRVDKLEPLPNGKYIQHECLISNA